jgi:hypothetical protein
LLDAASETGTPFCQVDNAAPSGGSGWYMPLIMPTLFSAPPSLPDKFPIKTFV